MIPKPVGRRREPPGQTALPFQIYCSTRLTRPTRWFRNQSDVGESLRDRQLSFSILRPARPTQPRCRLTARPSDPLNFAFLSKPVRLGEPRSPDGCRREHSRPDNLIFSSPRSTRLTRPTRQFWNHSQTSARASQPDNLTFPSPELGKVYPSDTAIAEATVGRRREPPSQTIYLSKSHARQSLPVRHGNCWSHRRTSARASQPDNSSFPSARTTISNSVERYVPGRSGNLKLSVHYRQGSTIRLSSIDLTSDAARASRLDNLTFSSYVSEANPSNRRACPPVGCRLSIPTKTLPFRLHLSDAVSLDLPSDAGASSPARHPYLF